MGKNATSQEKFRDTNGVAADPRAPFPYIARYCDCTSRRIMDVINHSDHRAGYHGLPHSDEVSHIVGVPAVEWCVFLERFSRRHRGWLGTVHGVEEDQPLTRMASERLESVSLERSGFDDL